MHGAHPQSQHLFSRENARIRTWKNLSISSRPHQKEPGGARNTLAPPALERGGNVSRPT
jgi:hypothetical protein